MRLEDGKLTREAVEGEIDRTAYDQWLGDARHDFLAHTALIVKALASLLPFARKSRPDRD